MENTNEKIIINYYYYYYIFYQKQKQITKSKDNKNSRTKKILNLSRMGEREENCKTAKQLHRNENTKYALLLLYCRRFNKNQPEKK